jgi:hypothetical protein
MQKTEVVSAVLSVEDKETVTLSKRVADEVGGNFAMLQHLLLLAVSKCDVKTADNLMNLIRERIVLWKRRCSGGL